MLSSEKLNQCKTSFKMLFQLFRWSIARLKVEIFFRNQWNTDKIRDTKFTLDTERSKQVDCFIIQNTTELWHRAVWELWVNTDSDVSVLTAPHTNSSLNQSFCCWTLPSDTRPVSFLRLEHDSVWSSCCSSAPWTWTAVPRRRTDSEKHQMLVKLQLLLSSTSSVSRWSLHYQT